MENAPFSQFTLEPNPSSLHFHQAAGDIQPQTRAGGCLLGYFRPKILLKNAALIFQRDAYTGILDPQMNKIKSRRRFMAVADHIRANRN